MTGPSTAHDPGPIASAERGGESTDAAARVTGTGPALLKPFEAAAFWAAVALPFLYIPLLLSGPSTDPQWTAAVGLIGVHAAALYVGHSHNG